MELGVRKVQVKLLSAELREAQIVDGLSFEMGGVPVGHGIRALIKSLVKVQMAEEKKVIKAFEDSLVETNVDLEVKYEAPNNS